MTASQPESFHWTTTNLMAERRRLDRTMLRAVLLYDWNYLVLNSPTFAHRFSIYPLQDRTSGQGLYHPQKRLITLHARSALNQVSWLVTRAWPMRPEYAKTASNTMTQLANAI